MNPYTDRQIARLRSKGSKRFWNNYNGKMVCTYCQVKVSKELPTFHPQRATVDHVVPLSKGGLSTLDNMVLACRECNNLLGNRPKEYKPEDRASFLEHILTIIINKMRVKRRAKPIKIRKKHNYFQFIPMETK